MEKQTMDFPTAAQLTEELKRIRYQKGFRKMLRSTTAAAERFGRPFDFDAVFAGSACDRNEHDTYINE